MIAMMLIAVIATDVAVAVLFLAWRRQSAHSSAAMLDGALTAEMEDLVVELRNQAEQATAEIGRQKAQLKRMLTDLERQQAAAPAPVPAPVTRRDVLSLAAEGHSFRVIAGKTGLSVEEVRLMLAMEEEEATAA